MSRPPLSRGNLLLLPAVLLLAVLRLALGSGGPATGDAQRADLAFGAFDPEAILRLTLAEADGGGEPLLLGRASKDAPWGVTGRLDFPALAFPIDRLLATIDGLAQADQVAEEASSHGIFGVADGDGLRLVLEAPGGAPWTFVLGHAGREGAGAGTYLRAEAEDRVFALADLGVLSTAPRAWIDPALTDLDVSAVARVAFTVGGQTVAVVRDDRGRWTEELTGATAPRVDTEDLLGFVRALVLDDAVAAATEVAAADFGESSFVLRFEPAVANEGQLEEPWPVVVELGVQAEDGRWLVRSGAWARAGRGDWCGYLPAGVGAELRGRVSRLLLGIGE